MNNPGPYREPDLHFDEMEEFLLLVSHTMNYASEKVALAKKAKDLVAAKFWTDRYRPLVHVCATIQTQTRKELENFLEYDYYLRSKSD